MSPHSTGAAVIMSAPGKSGGKAMRFAVRDRPVNLLFQARQHETFRLAQVVAVRGNDIDTTLIRDKNGDAVRFGYSQRLDYDVDRPGDYVLLFDGNCDPQSTITRREIGIQFLRNCCND